MIEMGITARRLRERAALAAGQTPPPAPPPSVIPYREHHLAMQQLRQELTKQYELRLMEARQTVDVGGADEVTKALDESRKVLETAQVELEATRSELVAVAARAAELETANAELQAKLDATLDELAALKRDMEVATEPATATGQQSTPASAEGGPTAATSTESQAKPDAPAARAPAKGQGKGGKRAG